MSNTTTIHISTQGLTGGGASLKAIYLEVSYENLSTNYFDAEWFIFDSTTTSTSWNVNDNGGVVFYRGWMETQSGSFTEINYTYSNTNSISVGPNTDDHTINILPQLIDWDIVSSISLTISPKTGSDDNITFSVSANNPQYYTIPSGGYSWKATYVLHDSSTHYILNVANTSSPLIVLPKVPALIQVSISVNSPNFNALPIESMDVKIKQEDSNELTHTFSSCGSPWKFQLFESANGALSYTGSYTVHFSSDSGLSPYTGTLDGTSANVEISEMGVREVSAASVASTLFDVAASVCIQYGPSLNSSAPLTKQASRIFLHAGSDYIANENLKYQVKYSKIKNTTTVSKYISPLGNNTNVSIDVINPFTNKTVNLSAKGLTTTQSVQLTYNAYEIGPIGETIGASWLLEGNQQQLQFQKTSSGPKAYTFYTINSDSAMVKYAGMAVYKTQTQIQTTYDNSNKIVFGPKQPILFSIKFDPSLLSFTEFTKVTVEATAPNGAKTEGTNPMTFEEGGQAQFWGYFYAPTASQGEYSLVINYFMTGHRPNHTVTVQATSLSVFTIPDYQVS